MKKALLGAVVTRIGGTEFADGQRLVKIGLEDGFSFNVNPESALLKKIAPGYELDLTYTGSKENKSTTTSGAEFTFHNVTGVKVIGVKAGEIDPVIAALPDVTDVSTISFKVVGGGTSSNSTDTVGKV